MDHIDQMKALRMLGIILGMVAVIYFSVKAMASEEAPAADEATEATMEEFAGEDWEEWEEMELPEGAAVPAGWVEISEEEGSMYEPETIAMNEMGSEAAISMEATTSSMPSEAATAESSAEAGMDEWEVIEVEEGATPPTDEEWEDVPESEIGDYEMTDEESAEEASEEEAEA